MAPPEDRMDGTINADGGFVHPLDSLLHGATRAGNSYDLFQPVRPEDVITAAAQQLTDWIGDGGLVTHLAFRNRAFVYPGDRLTCYGTVVEKSLHAGTPAITCALWIENQDGVRVLDAGRATITLPLRPTTHP